MPRCRFVVLLSLVCACQRGAPSQTTTPNDPVDAPPTDLEKKTDAPATPTVAAKVDGQEISTETVEQAKALSPEPISRDAALTVLVDRMLIAKEAERLEVKVAEHEIDAALEGVAAANGLTPAQLESAVADIPMKWSDYRSEVRSQMLEAKVMRLHGAFAAGGEAVSASELAARRMRLLHCLRAGAEIEVLDETLTLPDNPYAKTVTIEGARFHGDLGLPQSELEAMLEKAAPSGPVCTAMLEVEPTLLQAYLERGFVKASVTVRWPERFESTLTLDVDIDAGTEHRVGTIGFDTSAVPAGSVKTAALEAAAASHIKTGDVAAMSHLKAATIAINDVLAEAGLSPSIPETAFRIDKPKGKGKASTEVNVVDITYRVVP